MLDDRAKRRFQTEVRDYYRIHGRHGLPWRQARPDGTFDAYHIVVSELMLQQTQVGRVVPKYESFLERFPTVQSLAAAPLGDVLREWSGLGYNRRARFLWEAARQVVREHDARFPARLEALMELPGIGHGTAGAVLAYAYNRPAVFIETNIRTVYIHHFFRGQTGVSDKTIAELVAATLDKKQPREWYWALTDYGVHLKKTVGNLNRQSKSYARQSPFHGSRRQIRGQVLRLLGEGPCTATQLREQVPDKRLPDVLDDLITERLVRRRGKAYHL